VCLRPPRRRRGIGFDLVAELARAARAPVGALLESRSPHCQERRMTSARRPAAAHPATGAASGPRVLKKYPNRRLYDTHTSSYITLADVKKMVLDSEEFEVRDAKTGEDLTRSILLQIILEEESAGMPIFSARMLEQIIRFYGHAMQGMMGSYLEKNLQSFVDFQKQLVEHGKGFTPDAWAQLMTPGSPAMQNFMTGWFERSKSIFEQMQRSGAFFTGFGGKK
jgi:polyhydroxyalkanoate synthesis repressor PhaR